MKFPLPLGHKYGYGPDDVSIHDGHEDWDFEDRRNIGAWQKHVALTRDRDMTVTYRFDGPTQRAAIAVQRAHNLPITGMITQETWEAAFAPPVTAPTGPLVKPWSALEGKVHTEVPLEPSTPQNGHQRRRGRPPRVV